MNDHLSQHDIKFSRLARMFVLATFLLGFSLSARGLQTIGRNRACNLLVVVDKDTVLNGQTDNQVWDEVAKLVGKVNSVYLDTILKPEPNHQMYFRLEEVMILSDFLPGCRNESIVLSQFSKLDTSRFCLAHLLTYRDFGCVVGLANVGGLCKKSGNTGFTKTKFENETAAVTTMLHEIGHNFGAEHDGSNKTSYRYCDPKSFIMGAGEKQEFSSCSIQAMQHKIHQVIGNEALYSACFPTSDQALPSQRKVTKKSFPNKNVDCPLVSREADEECKDNPDPPEPPKPPPDPVCGNYEVEATEECDCGPTHRECDDPCCYPGELSPNDLALNASAVPCKRFTHEFCNNPYRSFYIFGLGLAWLAILFLFLFFALILIIDWKWGRRYMYAHVVQPDEDIRIDVQQHGGAQYTDQAPPK